MQQHAPFALARPFRGLAGRPAANPRGTPSEVLAELSAGLAEFKLRNQRDIDDINSRIAAGRIGSGAGSEPGSDLNTTRAREALGAFAKSGVIPMAAGSTDNGPGGGYVVEPELQREIELFQRDVSPMRRLARVVSTTAGEYQIPRGRPGMTSGWVGEKEARPETVFPPLALNSYPLHEIYANPAATQRLLDDASADIGAYLAHEIAEEFNEKEGAAFINGNGINKPRGFLEVATSTAADVDRPNGTIQKVATATGATVVADDLLSLIYALRAPYRRKGTWLMNSVTAAAIAKLKDGEERYIFQQSLVENGRPLLFGYPVEFDENMDNIGAGTNPVAFGDFQRGYLIVDQSGIRLLRDALTNKPYVQFYTTKRVGGGVSDSNAIKVLAA